MTTPVLEKSWSALFFLLPLCIALYFGPDVFLDPDSAWHLRSGQMIWISGQVPHVESWAISGDQRWYNISWLWAALTYVVFLWSGEFGLYMMQALLISTATWSLFHVSKALLPDGYSLETRAVAVALSGLLMWDVLALRPQLITYIIALMALRLTATGRLFWLAPLTVLWSNLHGSFILVYTIIGAFGLAELHAANEAQIWSKRWAGFCSVFKKWFWPSVLCALAPLLNPDGYHIVVGVLRTLNSVITAFIMEWRPFSFGGAYGSSLLIGVLLLLGGVRAEIGLPYKVLGVIWLFAALGAQRNFGYFAILGMPYIAAAINGWIEYSRVVRPNEVWQHWSPVACIVGGVVAMLLYFSLDVWKTPDRSAMPLGAITFINEQCSADARIFNEYNTGGYLAWWLRRDVKYFIDGRAGTAFSEAMLRQYLDAVNLRQEGALTALLQEYKMNVAIVSVGMLQAVINQQAFSKWKRVYDDGKYIVFQRRNAGVCKAIERLRM
jgi:hypothetical protein